jgi:nucleoside 2-deoxyribosyltransferase
MPVGSDPLHRAKQNAIRRGIESAGLTAKFPDYSPANPRFDAGLFSRQLEASHAVLADLTGERPSCYFEIGFAEALRRPVHLIAELGTDIHQSAFRHRTRFYADVADLEAVVHAIFAEEAELRISAAE